MGKRRLETKNSQMECGNNDALGRSLTSPLISLNSWGFTPSLYKRKYRSLRKKSRNRPLDLLEAGRRKSLLPPSIAYASQMSDIHPHGQTALVAAYTLNLKSDFLFPWKIHDMPSTFIWAKVAKLIFGQVYLWQRDGNRNIH